MQNKTLIFFIICVTLSLSGFTQEKKDDSTKEDIGEELIVQTTNQVREPFNPLSPAKAAFYSAILPGLGQAYNKKYWKIPIIYAAIGTGIYFYIDNNKEYNRYRDAYKRRLAGFTDDEFYGVDLDGNPLSSPKVTTDRLIDAQDTLRKNKELSLLITIGLYALNIIEANVNAHLLQYNVDDNLSFQPHYNINEIDYSGNLGLTLNYKF